MGTSSSAAQFVGKIRAAEKALADAPRKAFKEMGVDMEDAFNAAVRADLTVTGTPQGFSGWVPELQARSKMVDATTLRFAPFGKSVGPIRVAEQGRIGGAATDLILVGRVRKKSGTRRAKSRGRNQGATEGKETWSDATEAIEKVLPKKIGAGIVDAMRKVF